MTLFIQSEEVIEAAKQVMRAHSHEIDNVALLENKDLMIKLADQLGFGRAAVVIFYNTYNHIEDNVGLVVMRKVIHKAFEVHRSKEQDKQASDILFCLEGALDALVMYAMENVPYTNYIDHNLKVLFTTLRGIAVGGFEDNTRARHRIHTESCSVHGSLWITDVAADMLKTFSAPSSDIVLPSEGKSPTMTQRINKAKQSFLGILGRGNRKCLRE